MGLQRTVEGDEVEVNSLSSFIFSLSKQNQ